ncbi:MAG: DNRLRE domain-containing protein, partial [Catenulispora sp.]|nr:DNRLRE domain-containing protein [Catenulispora sp.]
MTTVPATAGAAATPHKPHVQPAGDANWKSTPAPKPAPVAWKSPPGRDAPVVKTDPHAKRGAELTDRRTADASYYKMSDGSVQEEVSAVPVHYRDAKGAWQDIDTTVKPAQHDGFVAGAVGNSFQTYFGATAPSLVRVEQGTASLVMGMDGATVSTPKTSGSTVTYPGALPGTDLSYQTGPDGVAERLVLSRAPAAGTAYSFTLKATGLTPKQLPGGAIAFYGGESGNPAFVIPAPYMADSKPDANSPYGFAYSAKVTQAMTYDAATGTVHVTVTPDASWLASKDRVFPVTVDPTIVVSSTSSTSANVMILADGATTNYDTSWRLSVGTTTTGAARSLIKFAMPSVPAGTTITSADLKLYYDQTFTTGSNTVPMQALAANAAWNPATATWSNASSIGGPVAGTTSMQANALGVWNDFPVTSTVQSWLNGSLANNGFVLKATTETTLGQGGPRYEGSGYYYNGEVKNYPKLVITYGVPGVTVNPPSVIHSTGAELTWPAYANTTGNTGNDLAEYQVHRSIYETFTPSANTEISPVASGTTNFVDSTAVPTPANNADPYGNAYYYMVVVKTKSGALIPGPTTVVRLPEAGRTTLLIPTQSATTLSSTLPTTVLNTLSNAGTPQPWLEVGDNSGTYGTTRAVLNFPALSAVPAGSTVLEAHLKLWQETTTTNTSGAVYQLHALTRPFTGSQATWNSAATGTAWTTAGGDFTAAADGTVSGLTNDPNRQNLDATSIVQGWVNTPASNDGLLVKLAAETSASPQERTIFAGPATAEPALAPALVVTYLDTSTESTYYAPSTPTSMNPGTTYSVPVTVNNTTASTWSAANVVLTYHWLLPDGTDVTGTGSQLQTALPSDLGPAATVTLNAQVTPPTPTDGNQAEGATLAWDMYNKSTGVYLSSGGTLAAPTGQTAQTAGSKNTDTATAAATGGGTGSLKQQVSVDPSGNNQLGLEKFYPYTTTPTGAGSNLYTNEASGNTVWNDDLFGNPSVGFDTTLRLSYNSMSTMDTTTGFGWSVQASAPIRLGQALQFQPPGNPTSLVMVDGTGNAHQWTLSQTTDPATGKPITVGKPPPGVHLYLTGNPCKPQDTNARAWKMTRPDRTTYYFDCEGYPTAEIDPNGNEADYTYSSRQSENKPEEFLDYITDPLHNQTLTLTYYNKGDSFSYIDSTGALVSGTNLTDPAIIDHVKSIADISGRTVDFYYTSSGLLGQVVDGAGTGMAKTFAFTYDATQGMKNVKLVAVKDPRLNTTNIDYYPTSSATKWWTKTVTDRNGHPTGFAYTTGTSGDTATVTDANGGNWVYTTDTDGRLTQETDPAVQTDAGTVSPTTKLAWDADNNVTDLTENNGAHSQWNYDPNTGYPNWFKDALAVKNGTAAATYTYATADSADPILSGHIAFMTDKTSAQGRRTHFTYYPLSSSEAGYVATPGYAGNLETMQDPGGTAAGAPANSYLTTYTYDMYGQLYTVKDANGHTTTYDRTYNIPESSTPFPEPTGLPRTVLDALNNATTYTYGSRGEVTSMTDPMGHTATLSYDVFLRPLASVVPKDSTSGTTVTTIAPVYDANDNVTKKSAPIYTGSAVPGAVTTTGYDKDDQPLTVTLPANSVTTPRTITYAFDNVGNRTSVTQPLGNPAAVPPTYTIATHYNAENEPDWTTDAAGNKTQFGYNDVRDKTSVTDALNHRSKTTYDLDHRITGTVDAAQNTTAVGYDLDGLKTSSTDQNGATTSYTLDPDGQLTQVQVPHTFDTSANQISYDFTQYTYDQVGNNTGVISPLGVQAIGTPTAGSYTTATQYDPLNRKWKEFGAYLANDSTYGQNQRPETDYAYDPAGRLTSVDRIRKPDSLNGLSAAEHAVTGYTYFDNGWTHTSTDPFHINTSYEYDAQGQPVTRQLSSSDLGDPSVAGTGGGAQRTMNWGYYPDGSLQTYTDSGSPLGWQDQVVTASDWNVPPNQTEWIAGPAGQGYQGSTYYTSLAGVSFFWDLAVPVTGNYQVYVWYSKAGHGTGQYSYSDSSGNTHNLGAAVDQSQNAGTWQAVGSPVTLQAGTDGQSIQLAPQPGSTVVADAVKIVRTDTVTQPTGPTSFSYKYDANGNVADIADSSPTAQFNDYTPTFNNLNQMTQLVEKKSGAAVHTLTNKFDPVGNLTYSSNDATNGTYVYNTLNQLTQVTSVGFTGDPGIVTKYSYFPNGQPQVETKGNGNTVTQTYNMDGTLAASTEATAGGTVVDQHQLTYDPNNNVQQDVSVLQNADTGATPSRVTNFLYSPNNQVTSVKNGQDDQAYTYDGAGNIEEQTVRDPATGNSSTVDFTYDRDRVFKETVKGGTGTPGGFQYDTLGRLDAVTSASSFSGPLSQRYQYDGYDNILSQSSTGSGSTVNTDTYTYDSLNRPITEAINAGVAGAPAQSETINYLGTTKSVSDEQINTPSVTDLKAYDYAPDGERLTLRNETDTGTTTIDQTAYYGYGPHQDVENLTGQTGATVQTYGYTAYGADDTSLDSGSDKTAANLAAFPFNSYRYNSARVATATGNLDMGFRTYDPNIDRFVSRDSFNGPNADTGLAGGSRYGFAGGNPVSNIELDGHSFWSWLGSIGGGWLGSIGGEALGQGLCNLALDAETLGGGIAICAAAGALIGAAAGGAA